MIDETQLGLMFQIVNSMSDGIAKMEEAYKDKKAESFEQAKREILMLQMKLSEELKKRR